MPPFSNTVLRLALVKHALGRMINMVDFKIVIADPKTGKCYQKELKDPDSKQLFGKKMGDSVKGELVGMEGYEFQITGGSDYCGFPMRMDIIGTVRKQILAGKGVGIKGLDKGERIRKTVAGNTIFDKTSQINLKVTKYGKQPLEAPVEEKKEEAKAEEKAEKKAEEKSAAAPEKKEEKKAEKTEEKKVEEKPVEEKPAEKKE